MDTIDSSYTLTVVEDNYTIHVLEGLGIPGPSGEGLPPGADPVDVGKLARFIGPGSFVYELFTLTKSHIGLGNVTDDAQLKRTAGDFQAFTQKITPEAGDSVLIEDGSDGNNKKRVDIESFLGGEWTLIHFEDIPQGSPVSAVNFIDKITDDFTTYRFRAITAVVDATGSIGIQLGHGAGPTWITDNLYAWHVNLTSTSQTNYTALKDAADPYWDLATSMTTATQLHTVCILTGLRDIDIGTNIKSDGVRAFIGSAPSGIAWFADVRGGLDDTVNKFDHLRVIHGSGGNVAGLYILEGKNDPS